MQLMPNIDLSIPPFDFENATCSRQRFVEAHSGELGRTVIDQTGRARQTSTTSNGDDMAVIIIQHPREKRFEDL